MKKLNILFCVFRRLRYCHSSFIIDVCQYVMTSSGNLWPYRCPLVINIYVFQNNDTE